MKVTVLAADLTHNCLSRAWLLARLLDHEFDVEIVGVTHRDGVWPPLRDTGIVLRSVDRQLTGPDGLRAMAELAAAADGDVVYASKPASASLGVGLLRKLVSRTPLLVDIDDRDLYFRTDGPPRLRDYLADLPRAYDLQASYYARLLEGLVRAADITTVTTPALQREFGGRLLPQLCDTALFDPANYDPASARTRLGLPADGTVVMFPGTPRPHKGLDDFAAALAHLDRPDVHGVVVGAPADGSSDYLSRLPGADLTVYGSQPLAAMPEWIAAADVVVVPQKDQPVSQYQFPMKAVNAMAMATPVVATAVSVLPEVLDGCGLVVPPDSPSALARALASLADDPALRDRLGSRARERCLDRYGLDVHAPAVCALVDRLASSRPV